MGTDANGYNFGPDMLSATEDGKWVSYVYRNPESGDLGAGYTGELELKNAWVVKHDGLLFASGWYVNADEFTKAMVSTAARVFRQAGLEGTIAYFASPESDFAGLAATIGYYNNAANVEGEWFAFIADESGTVIDHYDKTLVGTDLKDLLGTDMFEATAEGNWVTTEDVRVWLVSQDGMIFGSGWQRPTSPRIELGGPRALPTTEAPHRNPHYDAAGVGRAPPKPSSGINIGGPSHVQGERRCMPHPQTYRDCAALSRLKCTQRCVGICTYVENAIHPIQHHTLMTI